jgi:hypothetical protein
MQPLRNPAIDTARLIDGSLLKKGRISLPRLEALAARHFAAQGKTWNLKMTRAAILLVSIFCASSVPLTAMMTPASTHRTGSQAASAQAPAVTTQQTAPAQNPPTPPTQPSAATPAKNSAGQTHPPTARRSHHQRRVLPPNCNNAPATAPATNPAARPGTDSKTDSKAATASTNCPPSKVIVRHGSTPEPTVDLAGGTSGNQTSHQRDTANQMLDTTQSNLKKIAGQQLSANQQDMVNQIRQFMDQSKAAVDAGDLDRARTLAWKAQLLSEELVKPEK